MRVNWVVDVLPDGSAIACRVVSAGRLASVTGPIPGPWPWVLLIVRADLDARVERVRDGVPHDGPIPLDALRDLIALCRALYLTFKGMGSRTPATLAKTPHDRRRAGHTGSERSEAARVYDPLRGRMFVLADARGRIGGALRAAMPLAMIGPVVLPARAAQLGAWVEQVARFTPVWDFRGTADGLAVIVIDQNDAAAVTHIEGLPFR